jgi:hypothetical protein
VGMKKETQEKWAERIREWRAGGRSAEEFAAGRGYTASALRWAASQLQGSIRRPKATAGAGTRASRQRTSEGVATQAPAPRLLPVRIRQPESVAAELIIEVGGARVRVSRGADLALVGDVVRALQGGVR